MPALENPKHEEFAMHLARGVKQGIAYQRAGYAENKGAASRLAASPVIQDRVTELKKELMERVDRALAIPTNENFQSLKEMGLTLEWVAEQFKNVYTQALAAGSFAPANGALEQIKKMIEYERNSGKEAETADAPKFNMKEMLTVLDKMADVIQVAKQPAPEPAMIDITPKDASE